jgi:hypothetical protein
MKLFVVALSLSASAAFAGTGAVIAEKTLDGRTVYCEKPNHVNGVAYRPSQIAVSPETGGIRLSFIVSGLICAQANGLYQWNLRPLLADYSIAPSGTPIVVHPVRSEALILNRTPGVAATQTLNNVPVQTVSALLKLELLFSKDELTDLDAGKTMSARLQYFNRSIVEYYQNGAKVWAGEVAGGSYVYQFTVKKNLATGELTVSAVTVP